MAIPSIQCLKNHAGTTNLERAAARGKGRRHLPRQRAEERVPPAPNPHIIIQFPPEHNYQRGDSTGSGGLPTAPPAPAPRVLPPAGPTLPLVLEGERIAPDEAPTGEGMRQSDDRARIAPDVPGGISQEPTPDA